MNASQLQKDIAEMKLRLASMEAELNKPVAPPKVWRPVKFEHFHWVAASGGVSVGQWANDSFDALLSGLNNVYKTRELAEHAVAVAKARCRVVNKLRELEGDWEADWKQPNEPKYFVVYDVVNKDFGTSANYTYMAHSPEMYSSKDACQWVAVNMKDDLKLILGV